MDIEEMKLLVKKVIEKESDNILKELGFNQMPNDLIITPSTRDKTELGCCCVYFLDKETQTNIAYCIIKIYGHNLRGVKFCNLNSNSWIHKKLLYSLNKRVLFLLAHELRHYWQFTNNKHKVEKVHPFLSLISHKLSSSMEIDAYLWAKKYIKKEKRILKVSDSLNVRI